VRGHANLAALIDAVLAAWPAHGGFLDKRFAAVDGAHLAQADELAGLVLQVCGDDLAAVCGDYRAVCTRLLREELHFRRFDRYRHHAVADVRAEAAQDPYFGPSYANALLLSQALWTNHVEVVRYFRTAFLAAAPPRYRHLEIGPGHGLLLYLAARDPGCADAVGWDVDAACLAATGTTLRRLGAADRVRLERRDVTAQLTGGPFDHIVLSEVLEHLERPAEALRAVAPLLAPGGRVFVNMPVNSPAPDHVFLLRSPEAVVDLVRAAGFLVERSAAFPASGYGEQQARRQQLTMSVVAVARRETDPAACG
jgi:2-polyprenyl-3-methyl-5-hydroxy-6-metoxy-1,4-benzoquinol methylase